MEMLLSFITDLAPWLVLWYAIRTLRDPLKAMLNRVGKISIGEHHILLNQEIEHLPEQDTTEISQERQELISYSPRAAIIEGWIELEALATQRIKHAYPAVKISDLRQPLQLVNSLVDHHILSPADAAVVHQLRIIRNAAAHAERLTIDYDEALKFCRNVELTLKQLSKAP